jgi:hypothetical protein
MITRAQLEKIIAATDAVKAANLEVQRLKAINPIDSAIVPVLDQRSKGIRALNQAVNNQAQYNNNMASARQLFPSE